MPKTRFSKFAQAPVDKLKGVMLERQARYNLTQADIAKILNVSQPAVSCWLKKPTSDWPLGKIIEYMKATDVPFEDFAAAVKY